MTWSTAAGGQGGQQRDAFEACRQSPVHAYSVFGSKFLNNTIVLCPDFWDYPDLPPLSKSNCLTVDTHFNRFRQTGVGMIDYQLWVIFGELVHSYIYARSGRLIKTSTANDCTALIARNAVDSPRNYLLYAASELILHQFALGLFYDLPVLHCILIGCANERVFRYPVRMHRLPTGQRSTPDT